MNFETLKKEIAEIAEISSKVPEVFREKCFELLLNHLLSGHAKSSTKRDGELPDPSAAAAAAAAAAAIAKSAAGNTLTLPAAMKAFMRRNSVVQEEIESMVIAGEGEFHFVKRPTHDNVSKGQNEWALLLALKNGILNGSLSVDAESVRSIAQDQGFYDRANFAANFKSPKYAAWYKEDLKAQGAPVALSQEGETQLAALIKSL